jgi:type III secretory pathway lipoprotein EscJ
MLPISDEEAKSLIASSINGLSPEKVTVVQKPIMYAMQTFELAPLAEHEEKHLVWYLLALTLLALLVAFYGIFRLFIQKRVQTMVAS